MPQTLVEQILAIARFAPSGDNVQPWKVSQVDPGTLVVIYEPSLTSPFYQLDHYDDYLGLGAFLETLVMAAESLGYNATVTLLPEGTSIAAVTLKQTGSPQKELQMALHERRTDRRPYQDTPPDPELLEALQRVATERGAWLDIRSERAERALFSETAAMCDQMLWSTPTMRQNLIESFRFSVTSETTDGMPIASFGLGFQSHFFRLMLWLADSLPPVWSMMAHLAAQHQAKNIRSSGALGYLAWPQAISHTPHDPKAWRLIFLEGGQLFARLWIMCTRASLAVQPCFSPTALLLYQRLKKPGFEGVSPSFKAECLERLYQQFPQTKEMLPFMFFRLGIPKDFSLPPVPRKEVSDILTA